MRTSTPEMLASPPFKHLVRRRWLVSLSLLAVLFVTYYGYILLIAYDKPFMAQRIGEVTTLGIPLGVAVILVSWVLTAVYVVWANAAHDPEVRRLRDQVEHGRGR